MRESDHVLAPNLSATGQGMRTVTLATPCGSDDSASPKMRPFTWIATWMEPVTPSSRTSMRPWMETGSGRVTRIFCADENLRESEDEVRNGSALNVVAIQGRATVRQSRQSVLTADLQLSDLTTQLNDLLGLPLDTKLELDPAVPVDFEQRSREEYVQTAWSQNPQIKAVEAAVEKAQAAVGSARTAYIPDVTAYARQSYDDGVPFLARNFGTLGVNMTWDVFDFGKRRAAVRERQDQLAEAEENLRRLKDEVAVSIERSYNKVQRTKSLVEVATQVVKLREESERLARNQLAQQVVLISDRRQATAATIRRRPTFCRRTSDTYWRGRSFRKPQASLRGFRRMVILGNPPWQPGT